LKGDTGMTWNFCTRVRGNVFGIMNIVRKMSVPLSSCAL